MMHTFEYLIVSNITKVLLKISIIIYMPGGFWHLTKLLQKRCFHVNAALLKSFRHTFVISGGG